MSKREPWLIDAMAEVLEVDRSQLSATESFAELGVDSLLGLRLTRKLEDLLGSEVELEWLFDHPSVRQLACFLDERFGEMDAAPVGPG
ncbi:MULTISPECIES: acyl carrier protein [Lysobacter]|uniref:acyl carrier protein n=1 Tax=Lysobacter TaxID=68 RepID=UPI00068C7185|nr:MULTISPECIES: acyl carrier protein [Lysobacter]